MMESTQILQKQQEIKEEEVLILKQQYQAAVDKLKAELKAAKDSVSVTAIKHLQVSVCPPSMSLSSCPCL